LDLDHVSHALPDREDFLGKLVDLVVEFFIQSLLLLEGLVLFEVLICEELQVLLDVVQLVF
jgi:hypothetical protein